MSSEYLRPGPRAPNNRIGQNAGDPAVELDWIYKQPTGELTLQFNGSSGRLNDFIETGSELSTVSGAGVGDSFTPIRNRYADQLEKSAIGGPGRPSITT